MKTQNKLIGKIILSNFLEHSVEKFCIFIGDVESSPLYKKLVQDGVIILKALPEANILRRKNAAALARAGVIAKIWGGMNYSINYTARECAIEYQISEEKLASYLNNPKLLPEDERKNTSHLLNKLRRINTRNLIVHRILKEIVEQQRDYFTSNDGFNLKPFSRAGLSRLISDSKNGGHNLDFTIDTSRISRALRDLSIITSSEEEIPLRFFFPSRRDMVKRCIKAFISQEKKESGCGQVAEPYTDEKLRCKIGEEYGIFVTRREVGHCRKELGISPYLKRNGYVYNTLAANFSELHPFTAPSVEGNAPAGPGVYELCLDTEVIEYSTGCCQTFYVGSAMNLRKRLLSHLRSSSRNGGIKKVVKERTCVFRYLRVPQGWDREEKRFYNLFVLTYGDSPLCNHMSPKTANRQTDAGGENEGEFLYTSSNQVGGFIQ